MNTYLVERFLPGDPSDELKRIGRRAREACLQLQAGGVFVRYLGSTALPGEEWCFSLFEAPSRTAVEEANERGGLSYERILEAVTAGAGERGGGG